MFVQVVVECLTSNPLEQDPCPVNVELITLVLTVSTIYRPWYVLHTPMPLLAG